VLKRKKVDNVALFTEEVKCLHTLLKFNFIPGMEEFEQCLPIKCTVKFDGNCKNVEKIVELHLDNVS